MTNNIFLNSVIWIPFVFCFGQEQNRIENKIMECSYQSFSDGGEEFKTLISDYERLLIDEGILQDNSGESYRSFLKEFISKGSFDKLPSKYLFLEFKNIKQRDVSKFKNCQNYLLENASNQDLIKLKKLEKILTNRDGPHYIAKDLLELLPNKDFEIDFYKLNVFLLFNTIDTESVIKEVVIDKSALDMSTALKIVINSKGDVYIKNKKLTIEKLKKRVKKYELKNKSKSIISLKTDKKVLYSKYIGVQEAILEAIHILREEYAKEEFNSQLDRLSTEQLIEVEKVFPKTFIEY